MKTSIINIPTYIQRLDALSFMLYGFYCVIIGDLLHNYIIIDSKILRIFNIIGMLFVILGFYNRKKNFHGIGLGVKLTAKLLYTVCIVNFLIGIFLFFAVEHQGVGWLMQRSYFVWSYLMFFLFTIELNLKDLKIIFRFAILYVVTSILFMLYFFDDFFLRAADLKSILGIEGFSSYLYGRPQEPGSMLYPIAFFLVYLSNIKRHWKYIILVAFIFSILAALLQGRRSSAFKTIAYFVIPFLVYHFHSFVKFLKILPAILIVLYIFVHFSFSNFIEDHFTILASRIEMDTRSGTENDFFNDMHDVDWLFGRGLTGTFESPSVQNIDKLHRTEIETGYLNIILHGGLVMLLPLLCIMLYASYMGLTKSKNLFCKLCGAFSMFYAFGLYKLGGNISLTLNGFMLVCAARICCSYSWRNLSDGEILNALKL